MTEYEYDVALSFAGENREFVHAVAEALRSNGIRVFYDDFERTELWGKDLGEYLDQVYRSKAEYCVIFVSKHYVQKAWPTHEKRSAIARAIEERKEYILPARFDDAEIPGIQPGISYIDLRGMTPEVFASIIREKIGASSKEPDSHSRPSYRIPRVQSMSFNPYSESIGFMNRVRTEIENRCSTISHLGVSVTSFGQDREHSIRVVARGKAAYSLDMKLGGAFDDSALTFHGVQGVPLSLGNSFNASGRIEQSADTGTPILRLDDFSLFETFGGESLYTVQQFIDALWEKICDSLENAS